MPHPPARRMCPGVPQRRAAASPVRLPPTSQLRCLSQPRELAQQTPSHSPSGDRPNCGRAHLRHQVRQHLPRDECHERDYGAEQNECRHNNSRCPISNTAHKEPVPSNGAWSRCSPSCHRSHRSVPTNPTNSAISGLTAGAAKMSQGCIEPIALSIELLPLTEIGSECRRLRFQYDGEDSQEYLG